jgi:hypothetical protein
MSNNKQSSVDLLGVMAMMSAQSAYTNAYEDLTDLDRPRLNRPRSSVSYAKSKLTKKQVKSRAKSKASRKARKR